MIPIQHIREHLAVYEQGACQKKIAIDFCELLRLDSELRQTQQRQQVLRGLRNRLAENMAYIARLTQGKSTNLEPFKPIIDQLKGLLAQLDGVPELIPQQVRDSMHQDVRQLDALAASSPAAATTNAGEGASLIRRLSQSMMQLGSELKQHIARLDEQLRSQQLDLRQIHMRVPQPPRHSVPRGESDQDNVECRVIPPHRPICSPALTHQELGERLGLMDFKHAVKLSGARSYVLTDRGALLEQAILRLAYDHCREQNYRAMSVPVLVNATCMEGTGYFPAGKDQSYHCEEDELCLVGTGEVPVCAYYTNQLLAVDELPLRLFTQTSCFRREAGSYGKDTKGLYRVHQFQKVEQVIIGACSEELSAAYHAELLGNSEQIMAKLELPYRVVEVCTGDLGAGAYYKFDVEAWMPSRDNYGETHSCSAFLEYQSRRLRIRYKDAAGQVHYCHTLNNTAIASPRILIPFLEVHQTAGGKDVRIPQALQPYLGGADYLTEIT